MAIDWGKLREQHNSMSEEEKQERDRKILAQREERIIEKQEKKEQEEQKRKQDYFNSLPKRFKNASFENFVGLEEERKKVEKLTGGVLYGSNGNGKTHLGYSACRKVVESGKTAKLIKAFDFFAEIKKEFNNPQNAGETVKRYSDLDYLVIDECDKIYGSQTEYLSLIDLIGKRYDEELPTLLISNCEDLKELVSIISLSCVDKLRSGENIRMVHDKEDVQGIYKSKRGKDEQEKFRRKL
jgi:DNA replication protein DnaC